MRNRRLAIPLAFFSICLAYTLKADTVLFDFESTPAQSTSTPFNYVSGGITAHFSSPDDPPAYPYPIYSIQNYGTTFLIHDNAYISGNYVFPDDVYRHVLNISFSSPVTAITLSFATVELQDQIENPSNVKLSAFANSNPVGSSTAAGSWAIMGPYPIGSVTFNSPGTPFDLVKIEVPFVANGAVNFILDNVQVTFAPVATKKRQGQITSE